MNEVIEHDKPLVHVPATVQRRASVPEVLPADQNPMAMLARAVAQGWEPERLKQLMDLQERYEKNEARKAFVDAVAAFKLNPPAVLKDKENKQYGSMYTSIGNLVNTVNAHLAPHGLSTRWTVDQVERITVSCILTHRLGHSESASMTGPIDTSGQKNPLQQIKSTVTYLKIATFEAVTGIASSEGNMDDDGKGSGKQEVEPDPEGKKALEACGSLAALTKAWADLTKEQRLTLGSIKDECKASIVKADKA